MARSGQLMYFKTRDTKHWMFLLEIVMHEVMVSLWRKLRGVALRRLLWVPVVLSTPLVGAKLADPVFQGSSPFIVTHLAPLFRQAEEARVQPRDAKIARCRAGDRGLCGAIRDELLTQAQRGDVNAYFELAAISDDQREVQRYADRACGQETRVAAAGAACFLAGKTLAESDVSDDAKFTLVGQLYQRGCVEFHDARSCQGWAVAKELGRGLAKDVTGAASEYEKNSAHFAPSRSSSARLFAAGTGVPRDLQRALREDQAACDEGSDEVGCRQASMLHWKEPGISRNIPKAMHYADKACTGLRSGEGCYLLGFIYEKQLQNLEQAQQFYELGVSRGDRSSMNQLAGLLYERDENDPDHRDHVRARALFRAACAKGLAEACANRDRYARVRRP